MRKGLLLAMAAALTLAIQAGPAAGDSKSERWMPSATAKAVREATAIYRDPAAAIAAGYIDTGNCVSSRTGGAMGVHFLHPALLFEDDGALDLRTPEVLVYEPRKSGLQLVAVEYLSLDDGDPATGSPAVDGHLLNYTGSPNRYGLPPYHELHIWAWKHNPNGLFSDWNPRVYCNHYRAMPN